MNQVNLGQVEIKSKWGKFEGESGTSINVLYIGNIAIAAYRLKTNYYSVANILTGKTRNVSSENKAKECCEYVVRQFIKDLTA